MGDHATISNDPAANAPDAAFADKGKGRAYEPTQELSMEEDESDSSEDEMADNDEEDEHDNLEPISTANIIQGGRRTRGKTIDYAEAATKSKNEGDEMEEDDEDEDYEGEGPGGGDDDDQMRDV